MTDQYKLLSEVGVDYSNLANLLASGQWRAADEETRTTMLKISRRVAPGWMREQDFTDFPCLDLETIDELWVRYSQGNFGFSVQSKVWDLVAQDYAKFADTVGWRLNYQWQQYSQLSFNLKAPLGHLPIAAFCKVGDDIIIGWAATLKEKLAKCCEECF